MDACLIYDDNCNVRLLREAGASKALLRRVVLGEENGAPDGALRALCMRVVYCREMTRNVWGRGPLLKDDAEKFYESLRRCRAAECEKCRD